MKKIISVLCALAVVVCFALVMTVSAAAPSDALYYADFNTGPLAQPEESMQATVSGGQLYVNDAPISAEAALVDGALKLTLGTSGYYGINNTSVALRDLSGKLTDYKYLVLRMKGEIGNGSENNLMLSIGGGDGPHLSTMASSGNVQSLLDPDGCYMPQITQEYQDFVIALSQTNVRVNEGKLVSGINFNNSSGSITVYIDEIYLTSEIPAGFVSSGNKANTAASASGDAAADANVAVGISAGGTAGGTVAENVIVSGGSSSMSLIVIIILMAVVVINFAVLILIILKLTAPKKSDTDE